MSVINTNTLSLVAQGNLQKSQSALGSAIERLSSGLRINSAKDDAAGQAIANRFTANINGLTQATRNANDGISIAQTTEGALNEMNNNLQRVRELTVQAANGSNSASDLKSIQDEIDQRLSEIDRVSAQTQFNGVKVLASNSSLKIQVGTNDGETISINLQKIDTSALNLKSFSVSGVTGPITQLTDTSVTGTTTIKDLDTSAVDSIAGTGGFTVHGVGSASADGTYSDYVIRLSNGAQYEGAVSTAGAVTFKDSTITSAATLATATEYTPTGAATSSPLKALDTALAQIDSMRGQLGAVQNRFESSIANLNNTVTNLSSARSRIEDADYAVEVSNMTRAQILQQAGTSVLAQANQVPQTVLSLLK
ncbi:FliC/FljB family flagellin [Paralcaligenes sp. KSB-10]|uniref:FliC/FljB family flagellin n=1 Tax=Paralcaligenes sp. KSB-10 TaxID=2901142 RepID=UPI001E3846EA|nr:FliC/FljB family flagellin [Paralcaligenes sp. KSB-10]UHL65277.1 FliC/FljB family flagellin [Paralcaligenes sp. KSB-10]